MFFDLVFMILGCFMFPVFPQAAGPSISHVKLLACPQTMLRYLILLSRCCIFLNSATSCYAATWPSLPSDCLWSCDLAFMILICLIFSASCFVFDLPCLRWGPVFKMLCCLNFSISFGLLHKPPYLMLFGALSISDNCFSIV